MQQSCNYRILDDNINFTYSSHDFAAGSIKINLGQVRFFNIVFGTAKGYRNYVDFEYKSLKEYRLLIDESFGKTEIPLELASKKVIEGDEFL